MAGRKPAGARFPFLPLGEHKLEVLKTKQSDRKGTFVTELKIHATNNPQATVGGTYCWMQGCGDLDIALPSIMAFTLATIGAESEEQALAAGWPLDQLYDQIGDDQKQITQAFGPNPLKGRFVNCNVAPSKREQSGNQAESPWRPTNFYPCIG